MFSLENSNPEPYREGNLGKHIFQVQKARLSRCHYIDNNLAALTLLQFDISAHFFLPRLTPQYGIKQHHPFN